MLKFSVPHACAWGSPERANQQFMKEEVCCYVYEAADDRRSTQVLHGQSCHLASHHYGGDIHRMEHLQQPLQGGPGPSRGFRGGRPVQEQRGRIRRIASRRERRHPPDHLVECVRPDPRDLGNAPHLGAAVDCAQVGSAVVNGVC